MLSRFFRSAKESAPAEPPTFFSRYGGMWIDRSDFEAQLTQRLRSGRISKAERDQVRFFAKNGYLIIPQAVPSEACDRFSNDITHAWREGDERLLIQRPREQSTNPLTAGAAREQARVVDSYVYYESAVRLLLSEKIVRFMRIVFDDAPLLFQSLSFDVGSEQRLHQDTAYVVVSSPMELAASWIALENIQPGSGELMYVAGSHRFPEYHFGGDSKHWAPHNHGSDAHEEWVGLLSTHAERLGLRTEVFTPRKGDALIWHADLAHGGSPVADRGLTRKSLVGHYCPNRVNPHYFSYKPDHAVKHEYGGGFYSSSYYDLNSASRTH